MIIGKEALVNIEHLAKAQYQVYPDSADIGLELTDNMLDALRAATKTLKGIYSGTNYSPAPDYQGVKNIIIPNMFYRTDIGARWKSDSDLLQTWGYLT